MILCIDSGNTRIKWGLCDNGQWRESDALLQSETGALADLTRRFDPAKVILANVAGPAVAKSIEEALYPWQDRLQFAHATAEAGGVRNGYEKPQQLGVDRWSALIGARHLTQSACLVVMAGTATTIDTLDAEGNFRGGLILPGLDLMRRALARDTAALPLACGQHAAYPTNTGDAIIAGSLEAQAGAIERAFARLADHAGAQCFISGGAGAAISPFLGIPHRKIDNLVLEGLYQMACIQ